MKSKSIFSLSINKPADLSTVSLCKISSQITVFKSYLSVCLDNNSDLETAQSKRVRKGKLFPSSFFKILDIEFTNMYQYYWFIL